MRGHKERGWTDLAKACAVVVALLCVPFAVAAFDTGVLPGPAGGAAFTATGGTVTQPVVFTGDNSGGTGTVRIRPSDEDTQLVLCDASNNASPEVCSNWQHYNPSANAAGSFFATNLYLDSASTLACANGAVGSGYFQTYASNTQGQAVIGMRHPGGACSSVNLVLSCITTGATTTTCTWGSGHTTTTDFRGPILNGGSATCNGILAGNLCINDDIALYSANGLITTQATNATAATGLVLYTSGSVNSGALFFGNASVSDADFASKVVMRGVGYPLSMQRTDAVAAGTTVFEVMDNTSATGATLLTVDGDGNLFLNTAATRTKGTITLAAGTGTATVSSGCTPACSDTTAVNAVQCSVSGTTLTANGTGTDVISYVCL